MHELNEDLRHARRPLHADRALPSRSWGGAVLEAGRVSPEPWNPLVESKTLGGGRIDPEKNRHDEADPVPLFPDQEGNEYRQKACRNQRGSPSITSLPAKIAKILR